MPPLNPYEAPSLPAAPAPQPIDAGRTRRWLRWVVWLQTLGLVAVTLLSLADLRLYGLSLTGPLGVAVALPAALAMIMLLLGPCLWLWVLGKSLLTDEMHWWFVVLEPILWGGTWFAMLPLVQ